MLIDCKIGQLLWKTEWRFLQKLRPELLQHATITLKVIRTGCWGDFCTTMFKVELALEFKKWQQLGGHR